MNPNITMIYFGPPGTGKTTKLLSTVESLLADGFPSDQIMFISFTRKAANEAKTRAMDKFKFHPDSLPWFRTLHSLAFHQLGLSQREVMGIGDYVHLARTLGLSLTFRQNVTDESTFSGMTRGDRLMFMENMARATKRDLKEYWEQWPDEDIYWYELERLSVTLTDYKQSTGKRDFTDIITEFIRSPVIPNHRVLIVDEAQDLTPLQWEMVEVLSNVEEIHVAGDDDQAIFRWAGADVDHLINLPGTRVILPKSYRVPAEVQKLAELIVGRMTNRVPKTWEPRPAPGKVEYVTDISNIDMSQGTWLLLARNVLFLEEFCNHCLREGFVFEASARSPIRTSSFRAIRHWEELRRGEAVTVAEAIEVYDQMSTKVGVKYGMKTVLEKQDSQTMVTIQDLQSKYGLLTIEIWHVALDRIPPGEVQFFLAALKRGEKLLRTPRIKVSTIHGVKGGEADNVVIYTDMVERTWREYQVNPDDEHRTWYVAVTRAKEALYIVQPRGKMAYDI